jgi:hypothetical protein
VDNESAAAVTSRAHNIMTPDNTTLPQVSTELAEGNTRQNLVSGESNNTSSEFEMAFQDLLEASQHF